MLCPECVQCMLWGHKTGKRISRMVHAEDLETSRCYVCSQVWRHITPMSVLGSQSSEDDIRRRLIDCASRGGIFSLVYGTPHQMPAKAGFWVTPSGTILFIDVRISPSDWQRDGVISHFKLKNVASLPGSSVMTTDYRSGPPSRLSVISQRMQVLRTWLQECDDKHEACQQFRDSRTLELPKRLLKYERSAQSRVQLVLSRNAAGNIRYLALSHRWGGTPATICSMRNLKELEQGLPTANLPQTFRDACQVADHLQIEYLWIDALCIVQDDADDWESEAPKMDMIYANAYVVLAALAARSSSDGLFLQSSKPVPEGVQLIDPHNEKTLNLELHHSCYIENSHVNYVLNDRGWTFQERVLASRTAGLGFQYLSWECRSASYWQGFFEPPATSLQFHEAYDNCHWRLKYPFDFNRQRKYGYKDWENIVLNYTQRRLTCAEDRPVAISGIARRFSTLLQDEYMAGLWKSDFIGGLLWVSIFGRDDVRLSTGPSWSWQSISAFVQYVYPRNKIVQDLITVRSVECKNVNQDPFSKCLSGQVILKGHLISIKNVEFSRKRHKNISVHDEFSGVWTCSPDTSLDESELAAKSSTTHISSTKILPLKEGNFSARSWSSVGHYQENSVRALLLEPCASQPGFYRRTGFLSRIRLVESKHKNANKDVGVSEGKDDDDDGGGGVRSGGDIGKSHSDQSSSAPLSAWLNRDQVTITLV